jgi:uncharacterized protein (TIGR03067 family)
MDGPDTLKSALGTISLSPLFFENRKHVLACISKREDHMKIFTAGSGLMIAAMIFAACATMKTRTAGEASGGAVSASGDDTRTVQGLWRPAKAELAGRSMPAALLGSISLRLEEGKYEVFVGTEPDRGTYTLDPATTPRSMTITGTDGPNVGKTFPAIYELKGDTLDICYDLSGEKRPTEFKSVAGTKLYLVTYHRAKE